MDIEIAYRAWLPSFDACLDTLFERFHEADSLPGFLDGKDVTVERVSAFAEAAADFFTAGSWRHLANEDRIK